MNPARLAADAQALLGPVGGPVVIVAPRAPRLATALAAIVPRAHDGDVPAAALVALLGMPVDVGARQTILAALGRRLPPDGFLVLLDHNQPRTWRGRLMGIAGLAFRGLGPARARYPAARELAALGFRVERLRLACAERVQLVLARRGA